MATASFKGDFLGFTYNGKHSSDLNIVVVSGGNRFEKNLLPPSRDTTISIPNNHGSYFFESDYDSTQFGIQFAYDNVSEKDVRDIRTWLGDGKVHDLIFDEEPYKVYSVKPSGQPKLSYICFNSSDPTPVRVYKGEGTIQFQAYIPLARSQFKELKSYSAYTNVSEWSAASGLKQDLSTPTVYDNFVSLTCNLYNPGDMETPLDITEFSVTTASGYQTFIYSVGGVEKGRLVLDMSKLVVGGHYKLNSKLKLIQGYDNLGGGTYKLNNKVYNNAVVAGDFFNIQATTSAQALVMSSPAKISIVKKGGFDLTYNYLYY